MKSCVTASILIGVAFVLAKPADLIAQDTLTVLPTPAGNLNTIISGDTTANGDRAHPKRVYRLRRGSIYQVTDPMRINGNITIIANDSAGIRPPVLAPAVRLDNTSVDHFFDFVGRASSVVMSNLYMLSQRSDNNWLNWSDCIRVGAENVSLTLRGVIFEGWSSKCIVPSYWMKADIQDCVFKNHQNTGAWFGGSIFFGPGNMCLDTTLFINNTLIANNAYMIDIRGYCPRAVFEHNTCVYGVVNPFLTRQATNVHIKNNIFYALHAMGGNPDHVINGWFLNNPDTGSSSIISVGGKITAVTGRISGGIRVTTGLLPLQDPKVTSMLYTASLRACWNRAGVSSK